MCFYIYIKGEHFNVQHREDMGENGFSVPLDSPISEDEILTRCYVVGLSDEQSKAVLAAYKELVLIPSERKADAPEEK